MTYEVNLEQKAGYMHAIVTGMNSKENVMHYLQDIRQECANCNCFRVLIEEDLKGPRLRMMDVFNIASSGWDSTDRLPVIAYVDVNATSDLMKFAENVAVNRGTYVRVFSSVAEAAQWLRHLGNPSPEPGAPADAEKPRR
ncbi:MAG: hypothetical protein WCA64_03380 [Gallionella sp.]